MGEDIRDLIEKINQDGIKAAEEKAQKIEAEAKQRADNILARAQREADEITAAAKDRIRREEEKGKILLSQAGRDLLLSLRTEINAMLGRIMFSDIQQTLTPGALFALLSEVARNYGTGESSDIMVFLKKEDLEFLEKKYLYQLREEMGKTIILKPADEISGGFTISFDSGKSCYDFTDKALAEYIGTYLKPKLNQILLETVHN